MTVYLPMDGSPDGSWPIRPEPVPVVSVLMMVFNHEAYLCQAIESVVSQEGAFRLELLVGDDCSTDGSGVIARRYADQHPERIRVITADRNVGPYENYMRLLRSAGGTYIAHIDGDDYWLPGKLHRQVSMMEEDSQLNAVYSNALTVDNDGNRIGLFNNAGDRRISISDLVQRGNFLCTSSMLFRANLRTTLLEIGRPFIDYETHLRLAQHGPMEHIGTPFAAYRIGSSSSILTSTRDSIREQYWNALLAVPRGAVDDDVRLQGVADFLRRVAFRSIYVREPGLFLSWWARATDACPASSCALFRMTFKSVFKQALLQAKSLFSRARSATGSRILHQT